MPEPLSLDLRERIVAAYERGDLTRDQVAELFQVGRASVNRLVRRFRETGSVEPSPHGGGKPRKLTARGEKTLRALLAEYPDATIPEFVRLLMARAKLAVSRSTMSREIARLGFTQIMSLVATEQAASRIQALRDRFRARARTLDPRDLVFIDEAGAQIGMTREYARGPRGERVQGYVPRNRGTVTTMIGAMGLDGVRAVTTVEGATDAEVFEAFVTHLLVPKLKPGDVVVLDNVGAHKPRVRSLVSAPRGLACSSSPRTRRT